MRRSRSVFLQQRPRASGRRRRRRRRGSGLALRRRWGRGSRGGDASTASASTDPPCGTLGRRLGDVLPQRRRQGAQLAEPGPLRRGGVGRRQRIVADLDGCLVGVELGGLPRLVDVLRRGRQAWKNWVKKGRETEGLRSEESEKKGKKRKPKKKTRNSPQLGPLKATQNSAGTNSATALAWLILF